MRLFILRIIAKLKYPYYLIAQLNDMAKERDALIDKANKNNAEVLAQLNALTNQLSRMNKVIAHQRKRHNALTKRMNDYADQKVEPH